MPALSRAIGAASASFLEVELVVPFTRRAVSLRVYNDAVADRRPALVYLHGGYFTSGHPDDADALARAVKDSATVITVGYPLAPAAVFPDAVESAYTVMQWAARNARILRIDPGRLFIGGDQAGGTLAAAVAMIARDRFFGDKPGTHLAGQILITPLLDPAQGTQAMREAGEHACMRAWSRYLSRPGDFHHPYASPLRSRRLAGLAPVLLLTTDADPARDEAALYADNLRRAGVNVSFRRYGAESLSPASLRDAAFPATTADLRRFIAGGAG